MMDTDIPMAGHRFLDMLSNVTLGIVEIQMQFGMDHATPLLSLLGSQGNDHFVNKVSGCERHAL
jgi:hypothetical protein